MYVFGRGLINAGGGVYKGLMGWSWDGERLGYRGFWVGDKDILIVFFYGNFFGRLYMESIVILNRHSNIFMTVKKRKKEQFN